MKWELGRDTLIWVCQLVLFKKKLIEIGRIKYLKDKDGELRTIKGLKGNFMSKKDI